jgi:hypothetical protein
MRIRAAVAATIVIALRKREWRRQDRQQDQSVELSLSSSHKLLSSAASKLSRSATTS